MSREEILELYETLVIEHGQGASMLLQAIMLERLGKRIEDAVERLSDE